MIPFHTEANNSKILQKQYYVNIFPEKSKEFAWSGFSDTVR